MMFSGFFGIGGGFLIVPALMLVDWHADVECRSALLSCSATAFGLTTAGNYALSGLVDWRIAGLFIMGGVFRRLGWSARNEIAWLTPRRVDVYFCRADLRRCPLCSVSKPWLTGDYELESLLTFHRLSLGFERAVHYAHDNAVSQQHRQRKKRGQNTEAHLECEEAQSDQGKE